MRHWAVDEIGKPWIAGENDCWAFFRQVQRDGYGIEVPAFAVDPNSLLACAHALEQNPERMRWLWVESPIDGDAVLMGKGRYPTHIGTWIDADGCGCLHCVEGSGVVFQTLASLQLTGWNLIRFYRHASGFGPQAGIASGSRS